MSNYSDSIFTDDPNTPWYKVLKLIPKASKVLDIGCSSGNFGEILIREKKCIVDGLEPDKKDAEIAKTKLRNVVVLNAETDDLSGLDSDYDVIYFGDVIEHLVHPAATLKRVKGLLNDNGMVIFSVPNMSHISVRLMLMGGHFKYGNTGLLDKTHLHFYDRDEIERVFLEAGYEIKHIEWVQRDIPVELLEKQLKEIGLNPGKAFLDLAKSQDAAAYQYIGQAKPSSSPKKPSPRDKISPPIDMFEKHLADLRASYEKDVARLHKQQQQQIEKLTNEMNRRIEVYERSLSWKVTKPLRKVNRTVRKLPNIHD
jgi:2-polyprenyl-3-methyl-5-hydroxy-6-metoxy-1,4-benzoquinol methylase